MKDIYMGELVRLAAVDPDEFSKVFTRWSQDSEFMRLLTGSAIRLHSVVANKIWLEKELGESSPVFFPFSVRLLTSDQLIGDIILNVGSWSHRDAFVGISIGERENWGRGYGTDMMKVLLRYAFTEVNLQSVTLAVFEYNPRAVRSYEKAGFRHEGKLRKFLHREGRRWDMLFMSVLREEWMRIQKEADEN